MPIERRKRITREMLRAEPDVLFVFGDNMAKTGSGGQAREMRGEPNAVGIPTKHWPSMASLAFFRDRDFDSVRPRIDEGIERLHQHLAVGGLVIIPTDGIGTGLARLHECAPKIFAYITNRLTELEGAAESP